MVEIPERLAGRLGSAAFDMAGFVETVLAAIEEGAILLPAETVRDVRRLMPEFSPEILPDLIRKTLEITETEAEIKVRVDPFYLSSLREIAQRQGVELKTMIQAAFNYALDAGWLYESLPQPVVLRLEPDELNRLAETLGVDPRQINGQFIVEAVEQLCRSTKHPA